MPNLKSAAKRVRADRGLHQRNVRIESELKTLAKQFEASLKARQVPEAQAAFRLLTKKLDMACQKGVLHKNVTSRKKSRLSRRLAHIAAA